MGHGQGQSIALQVKQAEGLAVNVACMKPRSGVAGLAAGSPSSSGEMHACGMHCNAVTRNNAASSTVKLWEQRVSPASGVSPGLQSLVGQPRAAGMPAPSPRCRQQQQQPALPDPGQPALPDPGQPAQASMPDLEQAAPGLAAERSGCPGVWHSRLGWLLQVGSQGQLLQHLAAACRRCCWPLSCLCKALHPGLPGAAAMHGYKHWEVHHKDGDKVHNSHDHLPYSWLLFIWLPSMWWSSQLSGPAAGPCPASAEALQPGLPGAAAMHGYKHWEVHHRDGDKVHSSHDHIP